MNDIWDSPAWCSMGSFTTTVKTLDLTVKYVFQLKAYI